MSGNASVTVGVNGINSPAKKYFVLNSNSITHSKNIFHTLPGEAEHRSVPTEGARTRRNAGFKARARTRPGSRGAPCPRGFLSSGHFPTLCPSKRWSPPRTTAVPRPSLPGAAKAPPGQACFCGPPSPRTAPGGAQETPLAGAAKKGGRMPLPSPRGRGFDTRKSISAIHGAADQRENVANRCQEEGV